MDEGDMKTDFSEQEQSLRAQVQDSEEALAELQRELHAVDAELKELAEQGVQYDTLGEVCRSLEALDNLGAMRLFWQDRGQGGDPVEHIQAARDRIHDYGELILKTEGRRQKIVDRMGDQNLSLDCLHYELTDVLQREEERRSEWTVERELESWPTHTVVMPWTRGTEEDRRYRKSLGSSLLASAALSVLVASIAIPMIERPQDIELPERMAKLVRQDLPPPPPVAAIEEPVIEEEIPEPEELVEEIPPELVPESAEQSKMAAVDEPDVPDVKEEVKSKGILAFRESFASTANMSTSTQLGSQARVRNAGEDAVGRPSRNMVTSNAPGSSGGINLASISRDVGGGGGPGMGGVSATRVSSSIGTGGDGFGSRPMSGGALAGRTDEEIQIVFDRYKASLYRLYNRELRRDPTLRGQMILKLTIEPDGSVSFCVMQSSDMNAPTLIQQVVERVTTFDFGAKEDIAAVTIIYPIDFLPAA
jgi:hypothetical protein